jgi:hypothetical protein
VGRSGNSKQILLGPKGFSLLGSNNVDPLKKGFVDYNVKKVAVPDFVSEYQLGVTVYWPTPREEVIKAFGYLGDSRDKEVIEELMKDIDEYKNFLNWADEMSFFDEIYLNFPGEEMFKNPDNNRHALYLATVLDFRIDPLDHSNFVTLEKDTEEILLSSATLKDKLFRIERRYDRDYMISVISRFAKPLAGDPLKIGFGLNKPGKK